jgi:DNA-binding response OmpR family regulator
MTTRVLYIDDEDDIREVAVMALELDPDFEVRDCGSGAEAVEVAARWRPHLILLDVMMPGMDGPAVLTALRAQAETAAIPVAFITARTQREDVDRLLSLGACGVVAKPFDPMTLAERARALL